MLWKILIPQVLKACVGAVYSSILLLTGKAGSRHIPGDYFKILFVIIKMLSTWELHVIRAPST